jgi:capsular exopolysaccharide synthesis family protein
MLLDRKAARGAAPLGRACVTRDSANIHADEPDEQPLDLRGLVEGLRRRRWVVVAGTLAALVPVLAFVVTRPAVYQATAKLAIQPTPEVMDLGADVMPAEPDRRSGRWGFVEALKATALSSAVLGRVVDKMPATPAEPGLLDGVRARVGLAQAPLDLAPMQEREQRIESLRRSLTIDEDGAATVLLVSARGRDPSSAAGLANSVAEALAEFRREQRDDAARRALAWLNQRAYELRERIERNERSVFDLAGRVGTRALPRDQQEDLGKTQLKAELQTTRVDLQATRQRLAEVQARLGEEEQDEAGSEEAQRLRKRRNDAQAALEMARLRYTATHPEVLRLEQILSSMDEQLEAGVDPKALEADAATREEVRVLEAEVSRLQARRRALESALREPAAGGEDAGARSDYERLERELGIDRPMLEVLLRRRNETLITAATDHPDAQMLDPAVPPIAPISPNRRKLLLLGTGFALSFGLGLALLLEMLDRRVRDPDQAAAALDAQFLGMIPAVKSRGAERESTDRYASPVAESFRNLRTALLFTVGNARLTSLVVTSALAGEGKTTVSSNLAASFVRSGRRTLLVDADLRRPRLHAVFALERTPGLVEVARGEAGLEDTIRQPIGCDFEILTSGASLEDPSELLASTEFEDLLRSLEGRYDLVVIDSPVLLAVSDALLLAARADGTLLVTRPGTVDQRALQRVRSALVQAGARVLGFVFNGVERSDPYTYPSYLDSPYLADSRHPRRWRTRRQR